MNIETPQRGDAFSVNTPAMQPQPKLKPENDYITQALRLPDKIRQALKVWVIIRAVRSFGGKEGVPVSVNGKKILIRKDNPTLIPLDFVSVLLNAKTATLQEKWKLDGSGTYFEMDERMEYPMQIVNDTEYMPVLQAAVDKASGRNTKMAPIVGDEPAIETVVEEDIDIDALDLTKETVLNLRKILWTNFKKRPAKSKKKDDLIAMVIKLNEE